MQNVECIIMHAAALCFKITEQSLWKHSDVAMDFRCIMNCTIAGSAFDFCHKIQHTIAQYRFLQQAKESVCMPAPRDCHVLLHAATRRSLCALPHATARRRSVCSMQQVSATVNSQQDQQRQLHVLSRPNPEWA
jgi:hypothetical protein